MISGWPCGLRSMLSGPFDREEATLVVERPHRGLVEERAGRPVGDDGTLLPAVPEPAHHVDEFARDLIAQIVLVQALAAEVQRGGYCCW